MEPLEGRRLSGLASILNDDREKSDRLNTDRPFSSANIMATSVLNPSTYIDHPPPYPGRLLSSGLVSPPESRRTSGNEKSIPPPIQTSGTRGFSLPSIHEVTGSSSGPYGSPTSACLPPSAHSMTFTHGPQPQSGSRPPPEQTPYPFSGIKRQASPNPYQSAFSSYPRSDEKSFTFTEPPRHNRIMQPTIGAHTSYSVPQIQFEPKYEHDPRSREGLNGFHRGLPLQQPAYHYGPNHSQISPPSQTSTYPQPKIERRNSRESIDSWKGTKISENRDPAVVARQGVKRHLAVYDFENNLAEINHASCELQSWSYQFNLIAQEQQRSVGAIPARMPDIGSIEDMMKHQLVITTSLERMRHIIQEQASYEQYARDQSNRDYDDSMSMYSEDMKGHGYGSDNKKRRGRAAPPGRCHSCNRAETPEWRRGPDGARTLCNACGLHYAKLTRKNTAKQSQSSNGSNLRPKTMDDDPRSHVRG